MGIEQVSSGNGQKGKRSDSRSLKLILFRDGFQVKSFMESDTRDGLDRLCEIGEAWKKEDSTINTIRISSICSKTALDLNPESIQA